jgi:TPR repeat protein
MQTKPNPLQAIHALGHGRPARTAAFLGPCRLGMNQTPNYAKQRHDAWFGVVYENRDAAGAVATARALLKTPSLFAQGHGLQLLADLDQYGEPLASVALAEELLTGQNVPADPLLGLQLARQVIRDEPRWSQVAAQAKVLLARAYRYGWALPVDYDRALGLYMEAAGQGDLREAFCALGYYFEGALREFSCPVGCYEMAAYYYELGVAAGCGHCMTSLAQLHLQGRLRVNDLARAQQLLEDAGQAPAPSASAAPTDPSRRLPH